MLPLVGMLNTIDWTNFFGLITSESALIALQLSLKTAFASMVACVILGVPMAVVLARGSLPGLAIWRSVILLPLVLPPVVGGIALLYTFGRQGLIGRQLDVLGIHIAFTTAAVVLAQTFVALPYLVVSLEAAMRLHGNRYESVAATLGAAPTTVLRRVTLPLLIPAVISGAVLSFARALGEFGATLTFAGSLQGRTRTLPLEIYLQRETDPEGAVALSLLLVVIAIVVMVATRRRLPGAPW
ncbi:molybdate ABC transporter permease subunit [Skermania sp. ID1734]|nr:molybdate ABC transporter permease subunit [Skermania sp. ID1734]